MFFNVSAVTVATQTGRERRGKKNRFQLVPSRGQPVARRLVVARRTELGIVRETIPYGVQTSGHQRRRSIRKRGYWDSETRRGRFCQRNCKRADWNAQRRYGRNPKRLLIREI